MTRYLIACLLSFAALPLFGQAGKYQSQVQSDASDIRKYIASANLVADVEMQEPVSQSYGAEFSAYVRLFYKPRFKKGNSEYKRFFSERELFIKPAFSFVYRRHYHTAISLVPTLAYRHTSPKGIFAELNLDAGYYYAKLNDPVYEQQPDGSFEEVRAGFHSMLLGSKVLFGYDLSKKHEIPICLNGGAGFFFRYPNNEQWVRHIVVQAGLSYIFRRART